MSAAIGAIVGCGLLSVVGRGLIALPVSVNTLLRAMAATALMAAGVMAAPDQSGLFVKVVIGASIYAAAALAFDLLGARSRVSAVSQTLFAKVRRFTPNHGLK